MRLSWPAFQKTVSNSGTVACSNRSSVLSRWPTQPIHRSDSLFKLKSRDLLPLIALQVSKVFNSAILRAAQILPDSLLVKRLLKSLIYRCSRPQAKEGSRNLFHDRRGQGRYRVHRIQSSGGSKRTYEGS